MDDPTVSFIELVMVVVIALAMLIVGVEIGRRLGRAAIETFDEAVIKEKAALEVRVVKLGARHAECQKVFKGKVEYDFHLDGVTYREALGLYARYDYGPFARVRGRGGR